MRTYGLFGWHYGPAICSPLRDFRSDGVAQNDFELFGLVVFPCFQIVTVGFFFQYVSRLGISSNELEIAVFVSCSL